MKSGSAENGTCNLTGTVKSKEYAIVSSLILIRRDSREIPALSDPDKAGTDTIDSSRNKNDSLNKASIEKPLVSFRVLSWTRCENKTACIKSET